MSEPTDREAIVNDAETRRGRMLKYLIADRSTMQTNVMMREGAVIRVVGMQSGDIYAWAETPRSDFTVTRTFCVVPTGGDVPDPGVFLGTVFEGGLTHDDHKFVWHVYEVTP